MDKENLLKMADFIETVPPDRFDMGNYRSCVVGHSLKRFAAYPNLEVVERWGAAFTLIERGSPEWRYLFAAAWRREDNTPTGAAKRIRHLVEKGLPKNWLAQLSGTAPRSYEN